MTRNCVNSAQQIRRFILIALWWVENQADQGQRHADGLPDDGLQADAVGREVLTNSQRFGTTNRGDSRNPLLKRSHATQSRRLMKNRQPPPTQLLTISRRTVPLEESFPRRATPSHPIYLRQTPIKKTVLMMPMAHRPMK